MEQELLYAELSYKIRGCAFKVYNNLGFGHKENIYQKALAIEFEKLNINFEREKTLSVFYKNEKIGTYRPDFVVDNKIIVEIKAVPFMLKNYETQLIYYLKNTKFKLGFLINFGSNKIDIKRKIWTSKYL
jgi:GxxExxY protein